MFAGTQILGAWSLTVSLLCLPPIGVAAEPPSSVNPQVPQSPRVERGEIWQRALRECFKGSSAAIAIDLNLGFQPPNLKLQRNVDEGAFMGLLGSALRREVRDLPGGYALFRSGETAQALSSAYADALGVFSSCSRSELQMLSRTGVPFSQLSPAVQRFVAARCTNQGLQEKMGTGEFVAVSVRVAAMAQFIDAGGVERTVVIDPFARDSAKEVALREKLLAEYKAPLGLGNRKSAPSGDLDFGEGDVLTLAEVVSRAENVFKLKYVYDSRLSESTYFWRGKFDEKRFLTYLRIVAKPFEALPQSKEEIELKSLLSKFVREVIGGITDPALVADGLKLEEVLSNRRFSAGDLALRVPSWNDVFSNYQVDRNTPVQIMPALSVYAVAPGSHSDGSGSSPVGNRWSLVIRP